MTKISKTTHITKQGVVKRNPRKLNGRVFRINKKIEVVCKRGRTRDGFKHTATLYLNGIKKGTSTAKYLNRTWESFEFQSVLWNLFDRTKHLTAKEKEFAKNWLKGDRTDWSDFKRTAMVAQIGNVMCRTQKEKNAWKFRMIKAGLGGKGISFPENWDSLSEDTKEARLDAILKMMNKENK